MKPSIGRIVHLHSYDEIDEFHNSKCRAAIVTAVQDDGKVNLHVMGPRGANTLADSFEEGTEEGTWHWPERVD